MNPGHSVKYMISTEKIQTHKDKIYDSFCIKHPEKVNSETEEEVEGGGHTLFRGRGLLLGYWKHCRLTVGFGGSIHEYTCNFFVSHNG